MRVITLVNDPEKAIVWILFMIYNMFGEIVKGKYRGRGSTESNTVPSSFI